MGEGVRQAAGGYTVSPVPGVDGAYLVKDGDSVFQGWPAFRGCDGEYLLEQCPESPADYRVHGDAGDLVGSGGQKCFPIGVLAGMALGALAGG